MARGLLPAEQLDGRGFVFLFWFCLFFSLSLLIISNACARCSKSIGKDKLDLQDFWANVFNTQARVPQERGALSSSTGLWGSDGP